MKKVRIKFPQLCVESRTIEVSDEKYEELVEHAGEEDRANFIWNQMTESEKNWAPNGFKSLVSAIDVGYCGIESNEV